MTFWMLVDKHWDTLEAVIGVILTVGTVAGIFAVAKWVVS